MKGPIRSIIRTLTSTNLKTVHCLGSKPASRLLSSSQATATLPAFKVDGLVSAPCTPFKENGDVNLGMIGPYVDHLAEFDIRNVFLTGTTGEGIHMTVPERKLLTEEWMKLGRSKLSTMIVHIGTANIRDSQELAHHAAVVGADAVACVCPSYFKPATQEDLVAYMAAVASAAPQLPFLLYDIDFLTGIKLNTNAFFHLAKERIPNLAGCKHTSPHLSMMHSILNDHGDHFNVLMGTDEIFLEGLSIGLKTSIMSSFMGHVLNRIKAAFEKGDIATARMEQGRAVKVCNIRDKLGLSVPNATKVPLKILGLDMGQPRLPLGPYTEETVQAYKKDLEAIGFFDWGIKP